MTKHLGYIGIDQYGQHYKLDKHPRKELLEQIGATKADIMYVTTKKGEVVQTGYVIKGNWINVYRIHAFKLPEASS